jgi:hypothetical protein
VSGASDLICPADPNHGELYGTRDNKDRFYCAHSDHLGRGKKHPAGPLEPSSAFFTHAQVLEANARYAGLDPAEAIELASRPQVLRSGPGSRAKPARPKTRLNA